MKIGNVTITNWKEPGQEWWDQVRTKPHEPLIEARIELTLSWNEYHDLVLSRTDPRPKLSYSVWAANHPFTDDHDAENDLKAAFEAGQASML